MTERVVRVGIGVFIIKNGTFLVGRRLGAHGADSWSVPGGKQDFGETPEETAAREVLEETGLTITNVRFGAYTNDILPDDGLHFVTLWMLADWQAGEPAITEPDKFVDLRWVDFTSLPAPLFQPFWEHLFASPFLADIKARLRASGENS
jgi:8-oxo-dGTP diphosphatase